MLFKRWVAPCVAVPKGGIRQQWDKDSKKAESSEMVQTILHITMVGHSCCRGRSSPCFR